MKKFVSKDKVVFVPAVTDKSKNIVVHNVSKAKSAPPLRRQPTSRFVSSWHHCGKIQHIRPNCLMLRPREHVNDNSYPRNNQKGFFGLIRNVLTRLDGLDKAKSHESPQTVKQAWVRKVDHIHPLKDGSDSPA